MSTTEYTDSDLTLHQIDKLSRRLGFGAISSTNFDSFFGINPMGGYQPMPRNQQTNAIVLMTRPELNLHSSNILGHPKLHYLLDEADSVGCYVRNLLCPVGIFGKYTVTNNKVITEFDKHFPMSPMCDQTNPFIPLFSNSLKSIVGWKDRAMDFFVSQEGVRKEVTIQPDAVPDDYTRNDLTLTLDNREGNPIEAILTAWCYYMAAISTGDMVMHPNNRWQRRMDSQTVPYVLITDSTKTFVQKIGTVGYGYIGGSMEGAGFNWQREMTYNEDDVDISVPLVCAGSIYNDPRAVSWFNRAVFALNGGTKASFIRNRRKLIGEEREIYRWRAVPLIDPTTNELEWWIQNVHYNELKEYYGV